MVQCLAFSLALVPTPSLSHHRWEADIQTQCPPVLEDVLSSSSPLFPRTEPYDPRGLLTRDRVFVCVPACGRKREKVYGNCQLAALLVLLSGCQVFASLHLLALEQYWSAEDTATSLPMEPAKVS